MADDGIKLSQWIQSGDPKLKGIVGEDSYKLALWIRVVVSKISSSVASVPSIFKKNEKVITFKDNPDDPVMKLFFPPYKKVIPTYTDLIQLCVTNMELDGEVFVFPDNEVDGKPTNLKIIKGNKTEPMFDKDKDFVGWNIGSKKKPVEIDLDKIAQWKLPNPYDPIRGLSPLSAARFSIELDSYANAWNASFFQTGDVPTMIVEVDGSLGDEQRNQLYKNFKKYRDGIEKKGGVLILEGGAKLAKRGLDIEDFKFIEAKKLSREELLALFGVLPVCAGLFEYANYANSKEQNNLFTKWTVKPMSRKWHELIQSQILDTIFKGEGYTVEPDFSQLPTEVDDMDTKATTGAKLFAMGVPLNVVNETLHMGLPILDGGDVGYINGLPATNYQRTTVSNALKSAASDAVLIEDCSHHRKGGSVCPKFRTMLVMDKKAHINPEFVRYISKRIPDEIIRPFEEEYEQLYKGFFKSISKALIKEIEKLSGTFELAAFVFDFYKWAEVYKKILLPNTESLAATSLWVLQNELNSKGILEAFIKATDQEPPEDITLFDFLTHDQVISMRKRMSDVLDNATLTVTKTYSKQINEIVEQAVNEGWSMGKVTDEILLATEFKVANALTNAATVSGSAYNAARFEGYKDFGVKYHVWISMKDDATRPDHKAEDRLGEVVRIGEKFPVTGLEMPGDPNGSAEETINCRCTTLAVK